MNGTMLEIKTEAVMKLLKEGVKTLLSVKGQETFDVDSLVLLDGNYGEVFEVYVVVPIRGRKIDG